MVKRNIFTSKAGDTIVEVLIAMLVVGTVLGASYTAANRYYRNVRQAQEYSNAIKIAEGQLEQIKGYLSVSDSAPITGVSPFCFNQGIKTNIDTECTIDTLYKANIARTNPATNEYIYTVTVTWNNINGGSDSVVSLVYRLYAL